MKVLITDMLHASVEQEKKVFDKCGLELDTTFCKNEDEIIKNGKGVIGLLVSYSEITEKIFENLPDLRIVVKYGIGVDNIDTAAATKHGVIVSNVPDYCMEEVASQALMLVMNGLKKSGIFAGEVKHGIWNKTPETAELCRPSEISLGLVGFGRIARKLAEYSENMFKEILFYDPYYKDLNCYGCKQTGSLNDLFSMCKIISVHTPLTKETKNFIDKTIISCGKNIILVNTARAGVIDVEAVDWGLAHKNISYYGADTFWEEPPDYSRKPESEILKNDNVMITPHCGWYSTSSEKEVRRKAAEAVADVFMNKLPASVINKEVLKNKKDILS